MSRYDLTGNNALDAVLESIAELDKRQECLDRQRSAEIDELFLAAFLAEKDFERLFSLLSSVRPERSLNLKSVEERLALCKKLLANFGSQRFYEKYFSRESSILSEKKVSARHLLSTLFVKV